jgi:hypothetical protein
MSNRADGLEFGGKRGKRTAGHQFYEHGFRYRHRQRRPMNHVGKTGSSEQQQRDDEDDATANEGIKTRLSASMMPRAILPGRRRAVSSRIRATGLTPIRHW